MPTPDDRPPGPTASQEDLQAIAQGRDPQPFRWPVTHRVHGSLTFAARLPVARDLARHRVAIDNLLNDLDGGASVATMLLVTSIAGVSTLFDPTVVRETRELDEDAGHEVIKQVFYDPYTELDEVWLTSLFTAYSVWRQSFLEAEAVQTVGNSSGETEPPASSITSTAPTASPSTTLA